ncbi:hypothetical protein [Actinomycetospora aeridis]|uniref:Uncharacterized protein n=1 Tax=Actinomycetospora aeridis TaxID=3129231 RepID=A0ABU8N8H8_9PSEU
MALAPAALACEAHPEHECGGTPTPPRGGGPTGDFTVQGAVTQSGGLVFTIDARRVGGQGSGTVMIGDADGNSTGPRPVLEVVAPREGSDIFCVNFDSTEGGPGDGNRTNIYFRDSGDGLLTHDPVKFSNAQDITCETAATDRFSASTAGDFIVRAIPSP